MGKTYKERPGKFGLVVPKREGKKKQPYKRSQYKVW